MIPLYRDPGFRFRFEEHRHIRRFHLDGVEAGRRVSVFKIDPDSGRRLAVLAKPVAGTDGWVDLQTPITVSPGDVFLAVPFIASTIRLEEGSDREAVRQVNRLAFGQDDEARLVEALHAGGHTRMSLVAEHDAQIVGHILFSELPITAYDRTVSAVALAPMAVRPEFQHLGVGTALIETGLERCRADGHRIVVVLGHPEFYRRFGFSAEKAATLDSPFSGHDAFMALELTSDALNGLVGQVRYPPPFGLVSGSA